MEPIQTQIKISSTYGKNQTTNLSPEALEARKARDRFADYTPPEMWASFRLYFKAAAEPNSNKAKNALGLTANESTLAGQRVIEIHPKNITDTNKVILYLHGGAFTLGDPADLLHIPGPIADRTGWKVISLDYPLAPYNENVKLETSKLIENPFSPAYNSALAVYQEILKSHKSSDVVFLRDSAGGNLALGITHMTRDRGIDLPGSIITYAPIVDWETDYDPKLVEQTVVLTPTGIQAAIDVVFGKNDQLASSSPYASPIKGDLKGFPPIAMFTAERDLICPQGKLFSQKLDKQGVKTLYHCGKGLWHGYQEHYGMPEAETCADIATQFLKETMI